MKKHFFTFSLFFITPFLTIPLGAQSFSVPSPSASQTTKYGGASLNESTGRVIASIPLYNYQAGNISLPIGLTYIGNGVKVDQHSNWVGTNWLLNAGGVVTRVVNHLPDETAQTRLFPDDPAFIASLDNLQYIKNLIDGLNTSDDLRPDLFSFSFPGYSGNFYLDKNDTPRLMNANTELKIELIGGTANPAILNTIRITSPTGIQYFFGGDSASESSSTMVDTLDPIYGGSVNFNVLPKAITAFYLYKIVHPFGDQMHLEYHDDGDKEYVMFQGDELTKLEEEYIDQLTEDCESEIDANQNNSIKHTVYQGKIFDRKKISRVYASNSDLEVRFTSAALVLDLGSSGDVYNTAEYDDRVLNSIQVHNNLLNENVKQIKLEYLTTASRIFLEEVILNNENNITSTEKCAVYTMEYDSPASLPVRFSKAQDLLGYYNGNNSNTNLLPQNDYVAFEGVFSNLANRSINFNNVKKGSLTKIHYPSGGHTSFEYEAPKVKALQVEKVSLETYRNQTNLTPATKAADTGVFGEPVVDGLQDHVPFDQDIAFRVNVEVDPNTTAHVDQHDKIHIELKNVTTNVITTQTMTLSYGPTSFFETFNFHLTQGNSYIITMTLDPINPASNEAPFTVKGAAYYVNYKEFDAYGIRVKRTIEHPEDGTNTLVKRYYYKRAEKVFETLEDAASAVITYEPPTVFGNYANQPCCPTTNGTSVYSYVSLLSNPFSYFTAAADNQVSYKYVTVSLGGDFFESGGIEKQFRVEESIDPVITRLPANLPIDYGIDGENTFLGGYSDNNALLNGAPVKQLHIKNENGILYKLKEVNYSYNLQSLDQTKGIILTTSSKNCLTIPVGFYNPTVAEYNNFSYDFDVVSIETKDYINSVPVIPPALPVAEEVIVTERNFEYGVLQGLPVKITAVNSNGDEQIVQNYYLTSGDIAAMSGLTSTEIANYNTLISQNRIASPIQVENLYKKANGSEQLMSTGRVTYKDFNGLLLEETSKGSKLNYALENRITRHKYDNDGSVLEMSLKNDIKTSIIYGYKDKRVIAELINLPYDDIPIATLNNLHSLSNAVTNTTTMNALKTALDQLRTSFPQTQITSYVYNRLGQLASKKDARGYQVSYQYDACYRLKQVKDQDGNIIEEQHYNTVTNNN